MSVEKKAKWLNIGSVLEGKTTKNGKKSAYIKVRLPRNRDGKLESNTVTLTDGQIIQLRNPRESSFLTEEQKAKIPDYVKLELVIPPATE